MIECVLFTFDCIWWMCWHFISHHFVCWPVRLCVCVVQTASHKQWIDWREREKTSIYFIFELRWYAWPTNNVDTEKTADHRIECSASSLYIRINKRHRNRKIEQQLFFIRMRVNRSREKGLHSHCYRSVLGQWMGKHYYWNAGKSIAAQNA